MMMFLLFRPRGAKHRPEPKRAGFRGSRIQVQVLKSGIKILLCEENQVGF
jgi:hypothetical protein